MQAVAAAKVGFFRWTVVVMESMECMEFIDDWPFDMEKWRDLAIRNVGFMGFEWGSDGI